MMYRQRLHHLLVLTRRTTTMIASRQQQQPIFRQQLLFVSTTTPQQSKHKPDWMVQAELEAIAATNARAIKQGTANDTMMSKLQHELDGEKISNAIKLEDKLKSLIQKCHSAKSASMVDAHGRKVYNTIRKKAIETRQDLITQKEAAGMATDATSIVEAAFPIPASA